jgi:hypothetical protein
MMLSRINMRSMANMREAIRFDAELRAIYFIRISNILNLKKYEFCI